MLMMSLGRSPEVDHVEVDVGQRAFQRIERMRGVVLGAEQPFLLGGHGQEQDRSLGGRLDLGKRVGDFEDRGDARGVVRGPIVDLITLEGRVAPQVVPVGGIDHRLVLERRDRFPRSWRRRCAT